MERLIQFLKTKSNQLDKIKQQFDVQLEHGGDMTVKDVVFYDKELHEQINDVLFCLEIESDKILYPEGEVRVINVEFGFHHPCESKKQSLADIY